eukprot:1230761-Prymnesium_polylepis.2
MAARSLSASVILLRFFGPAGLAETATPAAAAAVAAVVHISSQAAMAGGSSAAGKFSIFWRGCFTLLISSLKPLPGDASPTVSESSVIFMGSTASRNCTASFSNLTRDRSIDVSVALRTSAAHSAAKLSRPLPETNATLRRSWSSRVFNVRLVASASAR